MKTHDTPTSKLMAGGAVLGLALAFGTMPAVAGGLDEPVAEPVIAAAPVVVPVSADWTGGYVGAQLGFGDISVGTTDGNGELYGLRAGYDFDFGSWVLGAGVDYDWSGVDLDGGAGSLDSVARLKVRAGAEFGQSLIYATAGLAGATATVGGTEFSDNGYFGGVGAEHLLNDQWSVGGEVLLHRFDDFDGTGLDVDATTATLNANFRF